MERRRIVLDVTEEEYVELAAALHGWILRLARSARPIDRLKLQITRNLHEVVVAQVTGQSPFPMDVE